MKRTNAPMLLASLLVLSLLAIVSAGCDGYQAPDTDDTDMMRDNNDTLPYTEPDTDMGGPRNGEPGTGEPGNGEPGMGDGFADIHDNTIVMQDNQFVPATLEITVGEKVTFFNGDTTDHDIQVGDEDLGRVGHGEVVEWTAEAAGTYPLICTIHPEMTGEIVVR